MCIRVVQKLLLFNCQASIKPESEYTLYGGVAQLGEHLPCKQGVKGSNPFISTIKERSLKMDEPKAK